MQFSEKDLQKISANPLFAKTEIGILREIFDSCGCKSCLFENGEVLRSSQSNDRVVGVILDGKASVSTPDASHSALLRFLRVGDTFGIANLFSEAPYISVIRADGSCRVFLIPEAAIRRLLEENPAFLYRYLGFLSGRIRFLNQKIGYLTAGSAERRLALYLISLGTDTVQLDASISSLSELLDVGRASLYRAFDKLTEDGFIRKEGRSIMLLDTNGMLDAYR